MAPHDLGERRRQRGDREIALAGQRDRDVVGGPPGGQPLDQPEPLLGEGERQVAPAARGTGTIGGSERRQGRRRERRLDLRGEPAQGRRLEERPHGEIDGERVAQTGRHLRRQQRVPPQLEEVGGAVDAGKAEHLAPDPRHQLLDGSGGRRGVRGVRRRRQPRLRRGEPGAVELAVGGPRQLREEDEGGGDHVGRQAEREEIPQDGRRDSASRSPCGTQ